MAKIEVRSPSRDVGKKNKGEREEKKTAQAHHAMPGPQPERHGRYCGAHELVINERYEKKEREGGRKRGGEKASSTLRVIILRDRFLAARRQKRKKHRYKGCRLCLAILLLFTKHRHFFSFSSPA